MKWCDTEEPEERGGESVNRSELHNTLGASYPGRLHNEGDTSKVSVGYGVSQSILCGEITIHRGSYL